MSVLPLLFDPRGVADRRAFWSGLIQLTVVSVVVYAGLIHLTQAWAFAALPAIGEAFLVGGLVGHAYGATVPDVAFVAALGVLAARLYSAACLLLKRSRDAGQGVRPLIVFSLASLAVHALMGLWAYDLFDDGMAVIVPLVADAVITALIGTIFAVWIGASPSRPGRAVRCPD
jgi:uncharacterized membrane protein YhaH (DUF805 family)